MLVGVPAPAADCGAHFGLREVTTMLTEEQAVAWEGSNKELFKQLHLEEWIRQNEAQGAEELVRRQRLSGAVWLRRERPARRRPEC